MGNVLAKLQAGKEVRIAYLGGSITAQNGWRPKTLGWFAETFPKAKVSEINAAIGQCNKRGQRGLKSGQSAMRQCYAVIGKLHLQVHRG